VLFVDDEVRKISLLQETKLGLAFPYKVFAIFSLDLFERLHILCTYSYVNARRRVKLGNKPGVMRHVTCLSHP
jgi:hypothetical protein